MVTQAPPSQPVLSQATVGTVKTSVGVVASVTAPLLTVTSTVKSVDRMIILPSSSKVQLVHTQQHTATAAPAQVGGGAKVQGAAAAAGTAYAIGVPQYVDRSTVYQAVPMVPGQQVVYWSPGQMAVVEQAQARTTQASVVMTTTAQKAVQFAMAPPKQATPTTVAGTTITQGKTQKVSVITIE